VAFITLIELVASDPEAKEEVVIWPVLSVVAIRVCDCKIVVWIE
jgi:hypothetical protein